MNFRKGSIFTATVTSGCLQYIKTSYA